MQRSKSPGFEKDEPDVCVSEVLVEHTEPISGSLLASQITVLTLLASSRKANTDHLRGKVEEPEVAYNCAQGRSEQRRTEREDQMTCGKVFAKVSERFS